MKFSWLKRFLATVLLVCLLLTSLPLSLPHSHVEAVGGVNSLTCAGFISNSTARTYIDTMMRYYINSSSTLRSTLDNGNSVVFMFEGGSDNYWSGTTYSDNDYSYRTQAVCIVVKKNSSGNAYIDYYCENSSSIPAEPTWCTNGVAYSGSTTLMDGTYAFYTWNHTGPYAAFQIDLSSSSGYCYYTPSNNLNGYKAGASGINIHTRSTAYNGGSSIGWAWSEGCQVIGYGNDSSNEFNAFMKSVTGITWNPWISWTNKTLNTWASTGTYKGYFVVDRQLGMIGTNGVQYGTGSLNVLYNTTALTNITAKSTAARKAAGMTEIGDYTSQCTYYPAYGKLVCTGTDVWSRTLPCYASTNSSTAAISAYNIGDELTTTGLFKNTAGEYWYRIKTSSNQALYVRAAYMEFKEQYLSDITLTGHTKPNGHVQGTGFVVDGTIATTYNQLTAVSAYIHDGLGTTGATETGHRVTVSNNTYSLAGSAVDDNTWMNVMGNGPHTMAITAEYKNCYLVNDTTVKTNTGKVVLAEDYFMVIPSSVSQSTCSHTYQTYPVGAASTSCTVASKVVKGCTKCGLMGAVTSSVGSHSFGSWVTTEATCTTAGSKVRTCTVCGATEKETIAATGHSYTSKVTGNTCQSLGQMVYTCTKCSHSYTEAIVNEYSDWSTTKPTGVDESLIETKTQYRYADYKKFTSYNASESGYTQLSKSWEQSKTGAIYYVPSWPGGFDKTSSMYNEYNGTKTSASESANAKRTITYDGLVGYLYYHWCYSGSFYSYESKQGNYTTFHSYYATGSPSNYECDTSDMSYKTSNTACCTNSNWYFVTNVNVQKYTDYKALYTHGGYEAWSDWSDTAVTASDTRKVETRTMYRYLENTYGDHIYENNYCTVCGERKPDSNLYLFGYINGADYGVNGDAENAGIYKFTEGKLVATFREDSYVGIKRGDNTARYMTSNDTAEGVTSATFYNTNSGAYSGRMFVPSGREVTFVLTDNGNDSYTLSYTVAECKHTNHDLNGECTVCGEIVSHDYSDGVCSVCGKPCDHAFVDGICTICSQECLHNFVEGECTICAKPCEHNFEDGFCTICSLRCTHSFSEGICEICGKVCNHIFSEGECVHCGILCEHSFAEGVCTVCGKACEHSFSEGVCTICSEKCNHSFSEGVCTICLLVCSHSYTEGVCTICSMSCNHSFSDGICTVCGSTCQHIWADSTCTVCQKTCADHLYINGNCAVCTKKEPDMYLFGYINGNDYGFNNDENNVGVYKFKDGTLKTVFTQDSYVAVKYGDNSKWFMTEGYQEGATTVTLADRNTLTNPDKLFVPKGRLVTFNLKTNEDSTLTLSYEITPCAHTMHDVDGRCTNCSEIVNHSFTDGICSVCAVACSHTFADGVCTTCGYGCNHIWINGKCNKCETVCEHSFTDGVCDVCGAECVHSFDNGICSNCGKACDHSFSDGICEECRYECTHSYKGDTCYVCGEKCEHNYSEGVCTICFTNCEHSFKNDICTKCDMVCNHSYSDGVCVNCFGKCSHVYVDGVCTICHSSCAHSFTDEICSYCGCVCEHNFTEGYCSACSKKCQHIIEGDSCTICGKAYEFYLVGNINGENIGCEENHDFTGRYMFSDGVLSAVINSDSYVFVKTQDNDNWYLADNGFDTTATLHNTAFSDADRMMFIPGGVRAVFSLEHNPDGTITLSYDINKCSHLSHSGDGICRACAQTVSHSFFDGVCEICGAEEVKAQPEISAKYVSLVSENELHYKVAFDVENFDVIDTSKIGLLVFGDDNPDADINSALAVSEGAFLEGETLFALTDEIHPMTLGDTVYIKVYAELSDGSYVLSDMISYNGAVYAKSVLRNPNTTADEKALMVSLLNYSSELQLYFGYKTDKLVNSELTSAQKSAALSYSGNMVSKSVAADKSKLGDFAKQGKAAMLYPTASFENNLFTLSYNCKISTSASPLVTLYYWSAEDYASADVLKADNATGKVVMTRLADGTYTGDINGISAKDMNDTYYVSAVYSVNSEKCCTGVSAYSLAEYFKANAGSASSAIQSLAKSAVVYGYYAEKVYAD